MCHTLYNYTKKYHRSEKAKSAYTLIKLGHGAMRDFALALFLHDFTAAAKDARL